MGQSLPYDSLVDCIQRLKPTVVLSSWLTAVDQSFITNYFKQLQADAPGVELMAGGAQIHVHSTALNGLITEVKGPSSLLALFQ